MLLTGALAAIELGLNRILALDSTALPRLAPLSGRVIAIECSAPALNLFVLPSADGLQLANHWEHADCTVCAPAAQLLQLLLADDKNSVLHHPEVELRGDSAALLALSQVLQDLELDWEYELSRWLGPLASPLLSGHLRLRAHWLGQGAGQLKQHLADFLSEESVGLVGNREAQSHFDELDRLKLALERLDARINRLTSKVNPAS